MKLLSRFWPALLASALLLLVHDARAGTLGVRDETRLLSSGEVSALKAEVARAPFDARLVVTTSYPDARTLSQYIGSLVVEPHMVVVGLDPEHHRVEVHFGTESGVARSEWPAIERAGNDAFRQGQWEQGVNAILVAAESAVPAGGVVEAPAGSAQARPSLIGPGTLLLIIGGIVALGVVLARRRGGGYGGPTSNYGGPPYGAGSYPGYGPSAGGGMGPVGGGIIGAGLGGLAGYELGKAAGEREERERDGSWGPSDNSADVGGGDSFDGGGGGSSWDDGGGGSDGGGGDNGGGGSDF